MSYRYPFDGTPWRNYLSQNTPIMPFESVTELALEGFAPLAPFGGNDGHPFDLYDSLEQEIPGRNAEALYFSMFGSEMADDVPDIPGHDHQEVESEIEWLPVWQSAFATGLAASLNIGNGAGAYWDANTYKELGYAVIPLGQWNTEAQTYYYFRARGSAPSPGSAFATDLDVKVTLFRPPGAGSIEITTQIGSPFVIKLPNNTSNAWVTAPPVDIAGETFVTNQNWRFMYAKFEIRASASPGSVVLFEMQVGRIPV